MAAPVATTSSKENRAESAEKRPRQAVRQSAAPDALGQVLSLQRAAGNGAVSQLLRSRANSQSGEADDIQLLVPPALSGGEHGLDPGTQAFMESRFQHDFSQVRIHNHALAAESAEQMGAMAYTVGNHIVFGERQYAPATSEGRRLLAHELAHVVQQQGLTTSSRLDRVEDGVLESEARLAANRVTDFRPTPQPVRLRAARGPLIQRDLQPQRGAGQRQATVTVRWSGDEAEFYQRLVEAVARSQGFRGVRQSAFWQPLREPAGRFHRTYSHQHPAELNEGDRVRVRVTGFYDPANIPAISNAVVDSPETQSRTETPAREERREPGQSRELEAPVEGEAPQARLQRQARNIAWALAEVVADADREGYAGVTLTIEHGGNELIPGFIKHEPRQARPAGTTPLSEQTAYRALLFFMNALVDSSSPGRAQIEWRRGEQGHMEFRSFRRVEPPAQGRGRSEREELDALGIPDRRQIYAGIFAQAERELTEAGVMIAGFAAEEIVLWFIGGTVLRALGFLGRTGYRALRGAISGNRIRPLAQALGFLTESEAATFRSLMQRVEQGAVLTAEEQAVFRQIADKLETAINFAAGGNIPRLLARQRSTVLSSAFGIRHQRAHAVEKLMSHIQRGDPAYRGLTASEAEARRIIEEILDNPQVILEGPQNNRIYLFRGDRGISLRKDTFEFDTFLDRSLPLNLR